MAVALYLYYRSATYSNKIVSNLAGADHSVVVVVSVHYHVVMAVALYLYYRSTSYSNKSVSNLAGADHPVVVVVRVHYYVA
jgi:hypothetical protein